MGRARMILERLSPTAAVMLFCAISGVAPAQDLKPPLSSQDKKARQLIAFADYHVTVRPETEMPLVDVRLMRRDFRESLSYLHQVAEGADFEQLSLLYSSKVCRFWTGVEGFGVVRHEEGFTPIRSDLKVDVKRWRLASKKIKSKQKVISVPGGFATSSSFDPLNVPDREFVPAERRLWDWSDAVRGFVNLSGEGASTEEIEDYAKRLAERRE